MAPTKYGKYLFKAPIRTTRMGPPLPSLNFRAAEYGVEASWILVPVFKPIIMHEIPLKHDFPQFLCILGSNPRNLAEFDAEIEMSLGEEGEKHTITSPTIIYISPGLVHCPLHYKRVGKPVFHLDIFFAPEYVFTEVPRGKTKKTSGTKYAKHYIKADIKVQREGESPSLHFSAAEYEVKAGWAVVPVVKPGTMVLKPHSHDFHQFISVIGSDPKNIGDFDAEIEICLGEEQEKHVINSPSLLHLPSGLVHGSGGYSKVTKPYLWFDIYFSPEYVKTDLRK